MLTFLNKEQQLQENLKKPSAVTIKILRGGWFQNYPLTPVLTKDEYYIEEELGNSIKSEGM